MFQFELIDRSLALFPPTKNTLTSQTVISNSEQPSFKSFKKQKTACLVSNSSSYTASKKIMNISEFLDKKNKLNSQLLKNSKNAFQCSNKTSKSNSKNTQYQKNRRKTKKKSQKRRKMISVDKQNKPSRRIEIIRSPPIKKKFVNWLRKEESSGKWIRQAESPIKQISEYCKMYNNLIPNVSPYRNSINSPASQMSLKHSLKTTIRTPSKTPIFRPKIINKSRSQVPNKNYSISPRPNKTRRSKQKFIKSKKNLFFEKDVDTIYQSVYDNKSDIQVDLSQFRSYQNHRTIDCKSGKSKSKMTSPLSIVTNLRF